MRILKYIFAFAFSLIVFASCFRNSTMEQKYTLMATFEYSNIKFDADSIFFGSAQAGGFGWNDVAFWYKLDETETECKGGFVLSKMKGRLDTTEELPANAYRAYCPSVKEDNIYTVFRYSPSPSNMPEHSVSFLSKQYGTCTAVGCYVTNSELVAEQVKSMFEVGDRLRIKAKGYLDNNLTGEAEINLAEYSADKDSIVSKWTVFDLSKLGSFDSIDFEVLSTKDEIFPLFCMDLFTASVHVEY